jgi:hypothetical protein
MDNPNPQATYVGVVDRYENLLAIGTDPKEAVWRAMRLGFRHEDIYKQDSVSGNEYRIWWDGLLPEQKALMHHEGGSTPPHDGW